jgi:hypothetical protein
MRYVFKLLCVCALGVVPVVGCGEAAPCHSDKNCDDRNECTDDTCDTATGSCFYASSREGEVCDNGNRNECTYGRCEDGACISGIGPSYWEDYEGKECSSNCSGYSNTCAASIGQRAS